MATCGVSAGGTLAMNYAYKNADISAIPVKSVSYTNLDVYKRQRLL